MEKEDLFNVYLTVWELPPAPENLMKFFLTYSKCF